MSDQKKLAIIATKGTLDWAYPPFILSSTAAAYISGVVLPVDGGWSVAGAGAAALAMSQQHMKKA